MIPTLQNYARAFFVINISNHNAISGVFQAEYRMSEVRWKCSQNDSMICLSDRLYSYWSRVQRSSWASLSRNAACPHVTWSLRMANSRTSRFTCGKNVTTFRQCWDFYVMDAIHRPMSLYVVFNGIGNGHTSTLTLFGDQFVVVRGSWFRGSLVVKRSSPPNKWPQFTRLQCKASNYLPPYTATGFVSTQ